MRQLLRMFSETNYKGTRNFINSQKKFEIIRTLIYFALPLGLFAIGYVTTGERTNLLTIVAVVGCLPACKSLVAAIMFLRYQSCKPQYADQIDAHIGELNGLYDMVFTSDKINYQVEHMVVQGNSICGFSEKKNFPEKEFSTHIEGILKMDGHTNYTVKIFTDFQKYLDRLDQLNHLESENKHVKSVISTLKSVVL